MLDPCRVDLTVTAHPLTYVDNHALGGRIVQISGNKRLNCGPISKREKDLTLFPNVP